MSRLRTLLSGIGVAAVAVGLLFVLRPSLSGVVTVPRAALYLLGAIAAVEGLRSIQARRRGDIEGADLPEVERGIGRTRPGDEFDRLVVRWSTWRDHRRIASGDDRVVERLRDVALAAIADRKSVTVEEAESQLERGAWTDDPIAAAFLGGEGVTGAPLWIRLRGIVRAGSRSRFVVNRTIDAITDLWEEP